MQQFEKAQTFFRNTLNQQIEDYIQTSEKVSNQYLKQKSEADKKSSISYPLYKELKRQVSILKNIQKTGIQVPGTSINDISDLIYKYQQMLLNYKQQDCVRQQYKNQKINNQQNGIQLQNDEFKHHLTTQQSAQDSCHQIQSQLNNEYSLIVNHFPIEKIEKKGLNAQKCCNKSKVIALKTIQVIASSLFLVAVAKVIFFI